METKKNRANAPVNCTENISPLFLSKLELVLEKWVSGSCHFMFGKILRATDAEIFNYIGITDVKLFQNEKRCKNRI
jgi:hypothetical protein